MASWLLTNRGKTVVVSHPTPQPALVTVKTATGADIGELANAYVLTTRFGRQVNFAVSKTLTDVFYYSALGMDFRPLQLAGLVFEPTCGGVGNAYQKLYSFFDEYKAVRFDTGYLRVTIDTVLHKSLLVAYNIEHAVGDRDIPLFSFDLLFVVLETTP